MASKKKSRPSIKLIDNYEIYVVPLAYQLVKRTAKATRTIGYFSSLQKAFERLGQEYVHDQLGTQTRTLSEALTAVSEASERVAKAIALIQA